MTRRPVVRILIVLAVLATGIALGRLGGGPAPSPDAGSTAAASDAPTLWTCSMHPQIRLPEPGACPICGMDLIPLESGGNDAGAATLTLSESARKLAEIRTTPVVRRFPEAEVRLTGKVDYDETRRRMITAWVGGRLDRLFVDYIGVAIRAGDHMVELYSPDLVGAQEELLQARRAVDTADPQSPVGRTSLRNLSAAHDKLRLLGLDEEQIDAITARGAPSDRVEIRAPIDGVVVEKHALQGDYVKTGSPIYTIADLSRVWVVLDAYESDLAWLRYGQEVTFETEAYPDRRLSGRIAFISPVLDDRTRTVKVRVNADNAEGLLKPGMFVHATAHPRVAAEGRVMAAELAGKWMCPMHPEVIADGPADCDICGMPLEPVADLGYRTPTEEPEPPLVIPASAPLITGRRAVVYVHVPGADRPTYEGREVLLGPRAGDVYLVSSGLREGEEVVVRGAFKLDSAMQIQAKPSMMQPQGDVPDGGAPAHAGGDVPTPADEQVPLETPAAFRGQLGAVADAYLDLTRALAADEPARALAAADSLSHRLDAVDMTRLGPDAHLRWMDLLAKLRPAARAVADAEDLDGLRGGLPRLTDTLAAALRDLGVDTDRPVRRFHCPMARDGEGADWLQSGEQTANPYYGASMLRCGTRQEDLFVAGSAR